MSRKRTRQKRPLPGGTPQKVPTVNEVASEIVDKRFKLNVANRVAITLVFICIVAVLGYNEIWKKVSKIEEDTSNTISNRLDRFETTVLTNVEQRMTALGNAVAIHIENEFRQTNISQLVQSVAQAKASDIITNSLNPQVKAFQKEVDSRIKEIERSKDRVVALEDKFAASQAEIQASYDALAGQMDMFSKSFDARLGDRAAYLALLKTGEVVTGKEVRVARSLIADLERFYESYKNSQFERRRKVVHNVSMSPFRPSAEFLYVDMMFHKDMWQRLASVEEIANRGFKYLVQDLVAVVTNDSNLLVSSRAVAAIETLSGQKFGSFPPFSDVGMWWEKSGCTNSMYTNSLSQVLTKDLQIIAPVDLDEKLRFLAVIVSNTVGLCVIRTYLAEQYIGNKDVKKAKEQYRIVEDECDGLVGAMENYAGICAHEGNHKRTVEILRKTMPYVRDIPAFEMGIITNPAYASVVTNQEFQSLFSPRKQHK